MSFTYLNPTGNTAFKDRHITKISETVQPYTAGAHGEIGLIGLPSSKSSISLSMAAQAPSTIRQSLGAYTTYSNSKGVDYSGLRIIDFGDVPSHPTNIEETLNRIHVSVDEILSTAACPRHILLGGDHGVSYPSIHAFQNHFGKIGVVQWDAHHDVRNLLDGGPTNGTPFRSLVDGQILQGEHLVQIGIRDHSNGEGYDHYAKDKGIHVYTMEDVEDQGILPIVKSEMKRLSEMVDFIYLSVDMDVVDQAFAPGCPAIGPGGLTSRELLASVRAASQFEKARAMDIVEIDPSKDVRDITSRLAAHTMIQFMYN
ncbi:formimidoylglutamase [Bacillaceae bacterium S4-13-58]